MRLSLNWLREFVPFEGDIEELGHRLTMQGLELEGIERPFAHLAGLVVGHVLSCEQHPDADKLKVCRVDVGGPEILDIVCGAPNVAAGQKVAVAPVGVTLPGGLTIKKAKLRGAPSVGMICSEAELELSEDHSGIMVLPDSAKPGARLIDTLPLDLEVCEIGITPNRGDCLSILGLAREASVAFGLPLTLPEVALKEDVESSASRIRVEIEDPEGCPLYYGRIIEDAALAPSPAWMRYRLKAMGIRSHSNVVDVTNYVLMELGHPLHSFDLNALAGGKIIVKRAANGQKFTTLDGAERELNSSDLLICDAEKAVALAGVMGGANSEIGDSSRAVFLETAVFEPMSIRRTARRLHLHSESSYRFERGVDQGNAEYVINRAAQLLQELTGGRVLSGICGLEAGPVRKISLPFRVGRACDLLGVALDSNFCRSTLEKVGCKIEIAPENLPWKVSPPSHRPDLTHEADLIEEVGRVYGLDRIEPTLPAISRDGAALVGDTEYHFLLKLKNWGAGLGLNEAVNYSFVGHKDLDLLNLPREGRISIMNPLSSEQDAMRSALAAGLLNNLRHNLGQGNAGLRLFETARVFFEDKSSETTAREEGRLGLLLYGRRFDAAWPQSDENVDYSDIKGLVEHLLRRLNLPAGDFALESGHPWLAPCVAVSVAGRSIGVLGQVKPEIADAYNARAAVWMAELDSDALRELSSGRTPVFAPLPQYPPVRRDITVMCPENLRVEEITRQILAARPAWLEEVQLVDIFIPEGKRERNLTFRLTFRHAERTLKDNEVDKEREKTAQALVTALPVRV